MEKGTRRGASELAVLRQTWKSFQSPFPFPFSSVSGFRLIPVPTTVLNVFVQRVRGGESGEEIS